MKTHFGLGLLIGLTVLSFSSIASESRTTGASEETAPTADCRTPLDSRNIDFDRGYLNASRDAEAKCHGSARQIGEFQVDTQCVVLTHIWNFTYIAVNFSAEFECE
jgi:hypothetical protein